MDKSPLVHPRFVLNRGRRGLGTHFHSRGVVQHPTVTYNDVNEEIIRYEADDQLGELPCYREPAAGSQEANRPQNTLVTEAFNVIVLAHVPIVIGQDNNREPGTISTEDLLLIDGVAHDITGLAHDDTKTITVVSCRIRH